MKITTTESLNGLLKTGYQRPGRKKRSGPGSLLRPRRKDGKTHWIEKHENDRRYPNLPVSVPPTRDSMARMDYNGSLDDGAHRTDYRLDCWQYMNNKSGARISSGFWLMAGKYE